MVIKKTGERSLQTVLDILEDFGYDTEDTTISDESRPNEIWVILHGYISNFDNFDMLQFEYDLEDAFIEVGISRYVDIKKLKPIDSNGQTIAVQVSIELRK